MDSLKNLFLLVLITVGFFACHQNKSKKSSIEYSTFSPIFHEKRDTYNRVIERWGNYHTDDRNLNFRHFFYYNAVGLLTNEKQYWFDENNKECVIRDTAEYRDIYYYYKMENNQNILELEKCYDTNYDSMGKFVGRKLYYIQDVINDKYIFRDDH